MLAFEQLHNAKYYVFTDTKNYTVYKGTLRISMQAQKI